MIPWWWIFPAMSFGAIVAIAIISICDIGVSYEKRKIFDNAKSIQESKAQKST